MHKQEKPESQGHACQGKSPLIRIVLIQCMSCFGLDINFCKVKIAVCREK